MLALPVLVFAFTAPNQPTIGNIDSFDKIFTNILKLIWPIVGGLAAVMIVVAGIVFITANGDPEKIKTARTSLIWAVIGIVVAILAWSIPAIVTTGIGG